MQRICVKHKKARSGIFLKINKVLKINGTLLDKNQLENHLQKIASNHNLRNQSQKDTYPVPQMLENYKIIEQVYHLLNEHLKLGISIHPAGEWLLDNLYIIEEAVKQIEKELTLKKYTNFVGVANGTYKGFARIYVLASEIVAYTDNRIERKELEDYLASYQTKKTLSMEEIWNIGMFLQIAIIENIREIAEKIYSCQIQKYRAESIVERLVENKEKTEQHFKANQAKKLEKDIYKDMKYPFIEYMSYILKRYGKKGYSYLKAVEEAVEMSGNTVSDVIKKEHFDMAVRKVSIGNSITSIKKIQRINFLEIFEKINGVEEILKQDPSGVYEKMEDKTKEYYRTRIKEIAKKTKISEIYIARKALEIAKQANIDSKQAHIGYYLIDRGINELYGVLQYKTSRQMSPKDKTKAYLLGVSILSVLLSLGMSSFIKMNVLSFLLFLIPATEIAIQIIQYIASKVVKPKRIPKLDYSHGIDEQHKTMVIIPTILKSKEKVQELMRKLEVFYLANQSENIYFTLLGDCPESDKREEESDREVIQEGEKLVEVLNTKYEQPQDKMPIFGFIYRKRVWNEKEGSYLGWERKRGMITQFNEYLLGKSKNPFRVNTLEKQRKEKIKYVITLDADTDLVLNSAFELIGAMAHILNEPVIDSEKNVVVDGYGIMQPRIGVNLDISYKSLFTQIFAGAGGTDCYTNAISDMYQDNFQEGIFTGKGIYDLEVYSKVLKGQIPENKVLSHDLLEGCYLRCGLVSDIMLMDGYPTKYNSFMNRLARWIRGDWQITKWLGMQSPLNLLSKYKIFDNLRRSFLEINLIIAMIYCYSIGILETKPIYLGISSVLLVAVFPYLLELVNHCVFKKEGEEKQKTFTPKISGIKGAFLRGVITIGCLPYKAYVSSKAILKTLYRVIVSQKHLLEWTTSEEAEKQAKSDLISYYNQMAVNVLAGIIIVGLAPIKGNIGGVVLGIGWILTPFIMWYISKEIEKEKAIDKLNEEEKEYVLEIGKRTWNYFETYLTEENNYLIPDNYQEDRKEKIVPRTSSTNIGLSLLAVISAYDLKYINWEKAIELISKIINTLESLEKWNGHLYNWYNIKTKEPLNPRYVSTVDSGNLVGYLYVTKAFLEVKVAEATEVSKVAEVPKVPEVVNHSGFVWQPNQAEAEGGSCQTNPEWLATSETSVTSGTSEISATLASIDRMIQNTDFRLLYNEEQQIFSIGFNIEENKLTDSYYDLLASEARQASLVAIAKKEVPSRHWNHLSRTLTTLGKYKGLVSWSGTAFEYLMPNVNIPKYEGSLLDESCKFLIKTQIEYSEKLNIPWGISEAAFNLKDLQSNYQYKAFGIPWLGLKRGLADEMVVSSYGSILAINEVPKEEVRNLKRLEKEGMYDKFGFYEAIDYTPERVEKGKKAAIVKTYMAHHQGLILLSINNLFHDNILQKRFMKNPEIDAVSILLQETMPETAIITKEKKEKVEKLKYKDYENYIQTTYKKIDERLITGNVISSEDYVIAMNQKGQGVSKYKDIYINRFKPTDDYPQGIFFAIKNIKTKKIVSSNYSYNENKENQYQISFMPDKDEQEIRNGNIKTKIKTTISSSEAVELRRMILENQGNEEEILEVTCYFEPVLSRKEQDYSHPAFNNLFLINKLEEETGSILIERKNREANQPKYYLGANLSTNSETIGEFEYEIDQEKFMGRGNFGIPYMVKNSIPLSKKIGLVTEPVVALKRTVKVKPQEQAIIDFILAVNEQEEVVIQNIKKYQSTQNVAKEFELSKARVEAESRYLNRKGNDIAMYQKILSYIIFDNSLKAQTMENKKKQTYHQSDLWKYGISGDLPIILLKVRNVNDGYIIKEMLKAYEFFKMKSVKTELVILDEEKHSYENYVKEEIEGSILNHHMGYLKNQRGGIFILSKSEIAKKDMELLEFLATIVIDSDKGGLQNNIKELEEAYLETYQLIGEEVVKPVFIEEEKEDFDILGNQEELKYYNEYGGFSSDGKEYFIKVNKENRLPTVWSHIMANEKFGTIVTENMGGYSWYQNCRLNRVSSWGNNPCQDIPSEIIYLKDEENQKTWSLGLNPMPDQQNYNIIYGFGYCKYIHKSDGIQQELEIFVPKEDSCKVSILNLKNTTPNRKKLKLYYYMKPVIGEDEIKSNGYIHLEFDRNSNLLQAKNLYREDMEKTNIYISSSEKIKSYTGDKKFFVGDGGIENPQALRKVSLNHQNSLGAQACMAYEIEINLESFESKEISIILGAEEDAMDCKNMAYKYQKLPNCKQELNMVKSFWKEFLGRLQVYTPLESTNILLNGWTAYQIINSRLLGKTGYYQSGGAYGFRDQLQDTIGLKYLEPEIVKQQIIKHSKHQFIEGDVEHWWHEENQRGIRTRFSDDLLWLAYLVIEYISFTGDESILDIKTSYLEGIALEDNQDERYEKYLPSKQEGSIYEHCIKAIERSLDFGENGIPKIGSGDWNDGFSTVGNKGKGESVWLGFFLSTILDNFIPICQEKGDEELAQRYEEIKNQLKRALNTNGWDGRWYKRAFMDDGNVLGSMENEECRIDSIAQSWSVISKAGDNDKKYISMESLENHLIDRENGIIKLLDPPFEKSKLEPGYIKAYLPGVRENGGQYTHSSVWVIIAEAMLGFGDKALELYRMINPIEHSRTKEASKKYKVEPYVIAADIYGTGNLAGRGGWTWYTGSASWYYKAGIENLLGLKIEKGYLKIEPCIPKEWKEYQIKYQWKESMYNITIKNPNGKNTWEENKSKILLNGNEIENGIKLDGSRNSYEIEVIL